MTNRYKAPGNTWTHTPASAVANNAIVLMGATVGVALAAIAASTPGPVAVKGVYTLPKLSTDVVAQGALLYWDNTNTRLTTTASGNTLAGRAAAAAGNGVSTVDIDLNY